jgi:anti-sigma regulatory factor (Ser/Thr protein kinase)
MNETQLVAELRLPALPDRLALVRGCVREAAKLAGCDEATVENLVLAVNEACMNVIQHGYGFAPNQEMLLRMRQEQEQERGALIFELFDHAQAVIVEEVKPRPLDEIRPGGLGVHLIRTIMDEVSFVEPPPGFGNLLRMVKRLER